jgi:hypothetical protein
MKVMKLQINIPENIKFKFINKCDYFELNQSNVVNFLIEKFNEGVFDEELGITRLGKL